MMRKRNRNQTKKEREESYGLLILDSFLAESLDQSENVCARFHRAKSVLRIRDCTKEVRG